MKKNLDGDKARINARIEKAHKTLEKLRAQSEENGKLTELFESTYENGEKRDEEELSTTERALLDILRTLELKTQSKLEAANKKEKTRRERIRLKTIWKPEEDKKNPDLDSELEYTPSK